MGVAVTYKVVVGEGVELKCFLTRLMNHLKFQKLDLVIKVIKPF